ncbi:MULTISPECIES: MBL fold metallo-hydrolase [Thermoanaerobacter]|jgi:glyoxylase-like metal-dependent hydrolase (beta-lactamase superfamily II)|uniref:Beta-lactamase domain protein n=1 Tax=Thermoanaerobacter italicus (strain DSM 9252 / Ab9) TaxID=580331 RepID=D3T8L1_THEIA|nr:MBL fold metallo-hydrolase [Thermoanaerobacter italicus]ADD02293.1 beta-lactamase domain protein [Thermoanaerobacter italicus Ab9]
MKIQRYVVGLYKANCYIVSDEETRETIVIDPGEYSSEIQDYIGINKLRVKYILLTHGHFDHIGGVEELRKVTQAEVAISKEDAPMLLDPSLNLSKMVYKKIQCSAADILLNGGDILYFGKYTIEVLHTPGHTKGGVCFKIDNVCFTGDTVFKGSIGRYDFPGGDFDTLMDSIKNKLLVLEDDVVIYPGHGESSTIGKEKRINLFLRE